MAKHTITLIPGDGIGPEIVAATVRIIEASGVEIEWETHIIGAQALEKFGTTLPEAAIESIKRNKVALKGPLTTPIGKGFTSVNVGLRKALDLYANVRPIQGSAECSVPISGTRFGDRPRKYRRFIRRIWNTSSFRAWSKASKSSPKKLRPESRNTLLNLPCANNRKKVTAVHKANIMKLSDGLFLECFYNVAKDFPDIAADDKIIDNCCMQLVMRPEQFDVMVLENLYGDIVSDLCAGLIGGLGLAPGANIGEAGRGF